MAKGAQTKTIIFDKIREVYPDAFWETEGKILRIPMVEDGNQIEMKVQLTCAKDNIGGGAAQASPKLATADFDWIDESKLTPAEPTEQEIANVKNMMAKLGL